MKALITGASSGIGREFARLLAPRCDHLVLVGRNEERLAALAAELSVHEGLTVTTQAMDLADVSNCLRLHQTCPEVDLLINNAGFGDAGEFWETDLDKDLSMIDTNIKALHILTKRYLRDMVARDRGQILNVASIAGFLPGPLMATYYATKSYVVRLSEAIRKELKGRKSRVRISILCPGPVKTNFEKTANVRFGAYGADARTVARYALDHLDRFYILPGAVTQASRAALKLIPVSLAAAFIYGFQSRRTDLR